jgi:hypothetical protein
VSEIKVGDKVARAGRTAPLGTVFALESRGARVYARVASGKLIATEVGCEHQVTSVWPVDLLEPFPPANV